MKLALFLIGVTAVAGDCVLKPGYHLVSGVQGDLTCEPCPPNYYGIRNLTNSDPLDMFQCVPCESGFYALQRGSVECIANKCGAGQMRVSQSEGAVKEAPVCFTCPNSDDRYMFEDEQCFCKKGSFLTEARCKKCPPHTYQDKDKADECIPCPAGTSAFGEGNTVCVDNPCSAGQKHTAGGCVNCNANEYSVNDAIECLQCPFGTFSSAGDATCSKNTCTVGRYRNQGTGDCHDCEVNTYQDLAGSTQCKSCPLGSTVSHTGATSASACHRSGCDKGKFSTHGVCQKCGRGRFSDVVGGVCKACESGRYAYSSGAESCEAVANCGKGHYVNPAKGGPCLPCPAGKFTDGLGSIFCKDCPDNHHTWSQGQEACVGVACDIGTYHNGTMCQSCAKGQYQPKMNQVKCEKCPFGKWQLTKGQSECKDVTCAAGQKLKGDYSCEDCARGTFNARAGSVECTQCPHGQHGSLTTKSTSCVETICAPGERVSFDGTQTICTPCDAEHFSPSRGAQTDCKPCPGATTTDGKTGQSACWAAAGTLPDLTTKVNYQVCGSDSPTADYPLVCEWKNTTVKHLTNQNYEGGVWPNASEGKGWHFSLHITHRNSSTWNTLPDEALMQHKCGMVLKDDGAYECKCWCWTKRFASQLEAQTTYHKSEHTDGELQNPFDKQNGGRPKRNPHQSSKAGVYEDYTWSTDISTAAHVNSLYAEYAN